MTIVINLVKVADAIAALNVSGVNVRDIDQIPESALPILPVLYPRPQRFITGLSTSVESFGDDDTRALNCTYVMNYQYLHAVVGSGGGLLAVYASFVNNIIKIIKAILAISSPDGAIDMKLEYMQDMGVQTDPAGIERYHGVEFGIRILEYIQ